jgi:hypothetical protein
MRFVEFVQHAALCRFFFSCIVSEGLSKETIKTGTFLTVQLMKTIEIESVKIEVPKIAQHRVFEVRLFGDLSSSS